MVSQSHRRFQKTGSYLGLLLLYFFMVVRNESVGVDSFHYGNIFDQIQGFSLGDLFEAPVFIDAALNWETHIEIGYRMLLKLSGMFVDHRQVVIFVTSTIIFVLLGLFLRKSPFPLVSIWLYFTLGIYQSQMNVSRNAMAILIVYIALNDFEKDRFDRFFMMVLMAAVFHRAVLLFIPVWFLMRKVRLNRKSIRAALVSSILALVFYRPIFEAVKRFLPFIVRAYLEPESGSMDAVFVGVQYLILIGIVLYFLRPALRRAAIRKYRLGSWFLLMNTCLLIFSSIMPGASRIAALFGPYVILYIPQLVSEIRNKKLRFSALVLLYLCSGVIYLIRIQINNIGGTMPYLFFWQ